MAEIDYSGLAATLVKGRDKGEYDDATASDLISDLEELAALKNAEEVQEGHLKQRFELLESAVRKLAHLHFDAVDEQRQMKVDIERMNGEIERLKGDYESLNYRFDQLEIIAQKFEAEEMKRTLENCAFDFEDIVQRHVTQSLELTKMQKSRIYMISLLSLIDREILLAQGSLLTQDQFDRACDKWSDLAKTISWNYEREKTFLGLRGDWPGPADPPGVSKEDAIEALDYLYPNRSDPERARMVNFVTMLHKFP